MSYELNVILAVPAPHLALGNRQIISNSCLSLHSIAAYKRHHSSKKHTDFTASAISLQKPKLTLRVRELIRGSNGRSRHELPAQPQHRLNSDIHRRCADVMEVFRARPLEKKE